MATSNPGAPKIISVIIKLFAAIPLLLGLGLLAGAGFTGSRQYTILKKWPTVDAEVARSELTHRLETFGKDKRPRTVYQAQMEFRYVVGGKQYIAPAGSTYSTTDYAEMKQKVDTYAPGTHHPVRYNPANPNDIRFDAGYTFDFFLTPLVFGGTSLGFVVIGAALFFVGSAIGKVKVRCPSCGRLFRLTEQSCPNCGVVLSQRGAGP